MPVNRSAQTSEQSLFVVLCLDVLLDGVALDRNLDRLVVCDTIPALGDQAARHQQAREVVQRCRGLHLGVPFSKPRVMSPSVTLRADIKGVTGPSRLPR
jgi:hypothetical protein